MVAAYAQAKAAREVIDYGDQVALAARIASRHPEVGAIERARYQVVLLDEYQDTSHAQLVLLQALFGGGHPVTAVGDPCQSIYGWRGASAGNLRRFVADFPVAGPKVTGRVRPAGSRSCPPASATPGASWTPPPPSRRGCGPRYRRCRGWCRPRGGPAGTGDLRPAGNRGGRGRLGRLPDRGAARPARGDGPGRGPVARAWRRRAARRRHRRPVPQAVPVPAAALGDRVARDPGRGGRPGRAAHRPRGGGRGRDVAGAARPGRVGLTGQAAHRPTVADRAT